MKKIFFYFLLTTLLIGQTKDPYAILNKVKGNFAKIKDYKAEVSIKVNMEYLKVPDMKATMYFKQPNKSKLDSKEFAMLPKQAFNFSPTALLDKDFNAIYVKQDKIDGRLMHVIKVIPNSDSSIIILSTLWIDAEKNLVRKVESTARRGGSTQIDLTYDNNFQYPLPKTILFSLDVPKLQYFQDPRNKKIETEKKSGQKTTERGSVSITYSNYKVNSGLSDDIFKEKKK